MANNALYDMHVFGSKESIDRLEQIMRYKDKEYCIYRVFSVERYDDSKDGTEARFGGDVAWGITSWFVKDSMHPESDKPDKDGRRYVNLLTVSKVLGLTIECYCEECGCCFMEYASVSNGESLIYDSIYWDDIGEIETMEDFNDRVLDALEHDVRLDMNEVAEVRCPKDMSQTTPEGCFSFGGYECVFHTKDDILNKVAPTQRTTIYRE